MKYLLTQLIHLLIMKRINFMSLLLLTILTSTIVACAESYPEHEWEWDKTPEETNPGIVELGWTAQYQFGKLPTYISIYKSPEQLESKKAVAYIAVADMSKASFSVLGEKTGSKTPSQFYEQSQHSVILNGGFFWDGSSLSMICRDGQVICPNNQSDSEDWVTIYYPTRAVFGLMTDGSYKTTWTYTTTTNITYSYPQPAENKYGETPKEVPSATFPAGGSVLKAKNAIGGGPMLIKDGAIKDTYVAELLKISADSNQPRSAIGITKDNKLILFVCEGREMTPGVVGYTTAEVAKILKSLGCVDAMNLDGGGSSCMLINGKETIKGTDGKQRTVVTAVGLR